MSALQRQQSRIFIARGCPGAGKTTWLSAQSRKAADKHGGSAVQIISLTKTAASEIAGRDTAIPDENCSTFSPANEVESNLQRATPRGGNRRGHDTEGVTSMCADSSPSWAPDYYLIPLHRWNGSVRAHAIISAEDRELGEYRWSIGSAGYAQRQIQRGSKDRSRKTIILSLHRAIAARMGIDDAPMIDHINRDQLDCRRANLRRADATINSQNRKKAALPPPKPMRVCELDGCDRKHCACGLCRTHLQQVRRREAGVQPQKIGRSICVVEGCDRRVNTRGYCLRHRKLAFEGVSP